MVFVLVVAGLLGSLAVCVGLAWRLRHDYDRTHPVDAVQRWYDHMLGIVADEQSPALDVRSPETVLPQVSVHPLVAGFAISTHALAYGALNASIAHLISRRVVEMAPAEIVRGESPYLENFLRNGSEYPTLSDDVLLIHTQRRALVHDSLDLAIFDVLVGLADLEARQLWSPPKLSGELPDGAKFLAFSHLVEAAKSAPNTYRHVLRKLEDASADAIRAQRFGEDAELESKKALLKWANILCVCLCGVCVWVSVAFIWPLGFILSLIAGVVLLFYCSAQGNHCKAISKECMRLRRELDVLSTWLYACDDQDVETLANALDADSWHQLVLYATVMGRGAEVGRLMKRVEPELSERVDFRTMLAWCGRPAQVANKTFMEATRQSRRGHAAAPDPQPFF